MTDGLTIAHGRSAVPGDPLDKDDAMTGAERARARLPPHCPALNIQTPETTLIRLCLEHFPPASRLRFNVELGDCSMSPVGISPDPPAGAGLGL